MKSEAETRTDYLLDTDAVKGHMSTGMNGSHGHKLAQKDLDQQAESVPPLQFDGLPKDLRSDKDHGPSGGIGASSPAKNAGAPLPTLQPTEPPQEEQLPKQEWKVMRAFLLSSQLSVIVKSRELKCMIVKKQDKAYFGEQVKKIFDERFSELEFNDIDRPMKEVAQIEKIRLDN